MCLWGVFILFKHRLIKLVAAFIGMLSQSAWASHSDLIELTLTPRLCVLSETERECSGQVSVHWQANLSVSACLFQEGQPQPLKCWQQMAAGDHILDARTNRSVRFYLATIDGKVLVDGWFEVLQQQTTRRKRRNPWSFY